MADELDLIEVSEAAPAPKKVGRRWLVTIARPGAGSRGTYPAEVLKETGPAAFPPGTKAFFNHDPNRDVRDMVGTYPEGAFWNDEAEELQAYLKPFARFESVLDEAGEAIEASIHAMARKDHRGVVRELVYHRGNTVDLVAFAGLEGSGLKFQVESLFAGAAALSEEGKEKNMEITEKQWNDLVSTVDEVKTAFVNFVSESKQEAQGKADAEAVSEAAQEIVAEAIANYRTAEKAIDDAKLPVKVAESLKERAAKGEDITADLAAITEVVNETLSSVSIKTISRGNVVVVDESHSPNTPKTFTPGRWSK